MTTVIIHANNPESVTKSPTRNVLITNVNDSGEDVMAYTRLTAETLSNAYRQSGKVTFDEIYEVPDCDVQFYLYEPCWLTEAEEARAIELAAAYVPPSPESDVERARRIVGEYGF